MRLLSPVFAVLAELLRIAREMLVIPAQLWLALAELAGRVVLAAWHLVKPALVAAIALAMAALRAGQRHVTPARALAVVCLGALVALVASQWVDYRGIGVGTEQYGPETATVAPPPDVAREPAGDAHAWVMLPLAAAGLVLLGVAVGGRWRVARLLLPLGLAVIAISLLVDAPKGLDEGSAALTYESAEARLLEGFWVQIVAGAVIGACGLLLAGALRSEPGALAWRPRRRSRSGAVEEEAAARGSSPLADPPIQFTRRGSPRPG